jgi:hypothetical protein
MTKTIIEKSNHSKIEVRNSAKGAIFTITIDSYIEEGSKI